MVLNRSQFALLKLNCWQIELVTISSIGLVLYLNQITSWSDPVVASSSTAQLVTESNVEGVVKVRSRMEVPVPIW